MRAARQPIVIALLLGAQASVSAFEFSLREPAFSLSVPGVPDIALGEEAVSADASGRRVLAGKDEIYAVDIELSRQSGEMSPRICATVMLRSIMDRPGAPPRASVYRAPLDVNTFLVIYALGEGEQARLHAHLISSAGSDHCANAHFARAAKPGEDVDAWRSSFTSARIGSAQGKRPE